MMVLLAWRKADEESIGLRNLPKELIRAIIDFLNEEPLACKLANILGHYASYYTIGAPYLTPEWFQQNKWGLKFYFKHLQKFTHFSRAKSTHALNALKSSFFKQHMPVKFPPQCFIRKLWLVLFKYGAPAVDHLTRGKFMAGELSIAALKTQNRRTLKLMLEKNMFVMPTIENFAASVKPKHRITYEEARDLIDEISKTNAAERDNRS